MTGLDFEGWSIVVTGASGGLGRAIAVECSTRGAARVVINFMSDRAGAEETADLIRRNGADPLLVQGDVGSAEACERIVSQASPIGRIDALFNNAGTTVLAPDHSRLEAVTDSDFIRIYRANVVGAYQMIRAARPLLEAAPTPGVVNTASIAAITGIGTSVPYAASKGALVTMTLSLARALAPRIRVNAVCPGFIDTGWFDKASQRSNGTPIDMAQLRSTVLEANPLRVASKPEDVAGAAAFLASPAARHITGETLLVDAGQHLG